MIDRSLRQDAVAQIEDVPWSSPGHFQHLCDALADVWAIGQQHAGIQVPLDRRVVEITCHASSSGIRQSTPTTSLPPSDSSVLRAGLPVAKLMTGTPGTIPAMICCTKGKTNCR